MIIGIVSGYFNPLHVGHLEYIHHSKLRCEWLVAIVNNDYQVSLKGSHPFMGAKDRVKIIDSLRDVDTTILSIDDDRSVCKSIQYIRTLWPEPRHEMIFFNSGDRIEVGTDMLEYPACKDCNIQMVILPLPKIRASSELLKFDNK